MNDIIEDGDKTFEDLLKEIREKPISDFEQDCGEYPIVLTRDGSVIHRKWTYYEEEKRGEYVEHDVSSALVDYLHLPVRIENGFLLKHVFDLIADPLTADLLDLIFKNCFVKVYSNHYKDNLRDSYVDKVEQYSPDAIERLCVYWWAEMDGEYLEQSVSFDGDGFILQDDVYGDQEWDKDILMYKKGTRINWGIDFSPLENLLHLPIVLDEEFGVREDLAKHRDWKTADGVIFKCKKKFTLKEVLEGILWEISFYGTPEAAKEKGDELKRRVDDLDEYIKRKDNGDSDKQRNLD